MPLSLNPLAQLVNNVSQSISGAASQAGTSLNNMTASLSKTNLDAVSSRISGGLGSGLNGITAGVGNSIDQGMAGVRGLTGSISGTGLPALGGITGQAQNLVSKVGTGVGTISNVTSDIATSLNKLGGGNIAGGLMGIAGAVSKAAGQLNNILSLARGINLPSNAELFQTRGAVVSMTPVPGNDWRVRINCNWELFDSPLFDSTLKETGGLVWPYLPNITVSSKANYSQLDPVHNIYPFQAYKSSAIEDIQISGEFSVETETDAYYWVAATTWLRTVTKMFYGTGPNVGNPPIICQLTGYGSNVFNTVPVVIKSTSFDFKEDVQYVKCQINGMAQPTWVPTLSTISVTVSPIYNRARLRQFSLEDFASGDTAKTTGFL